MLTGVLKAIFKAAVPAGARKAIKRWVREATEDPGPPDLRRALSFAYLQGRGIEIGALNRPLPLSRHATVSYVDRLTVEKARQHYPELANEALVTVDIVTDGETLKAIADASQDFVIANHFLEHTQDPIGALRNFTRVLKPGGMLFLAIPDQRFTFDKARPQTTWDHLLRDSLQGPECSRLAHYQEWVRLVLGMTDEAAAQQEMQRLIDSGYSIHFHAWRSEGAMEFVARALEHLGRPFEVISMTFNQPVGEVILLFKMGQA